MTDPWAMSEEHRERLMRIARRRTFSREDAEDIVQEAMLRVATFTDLDPERLGQLLTSVTVRLCADLARHREVAGRKMPEMLPVPGDPLTDMLDEAEARWLASVPLTKVERTLFLARVHGLYPSEVAASLGLSVASAKSALVRARRKILAAWRATLGLLGLPRLRRLILPVGGAAVLAASVLLLAPPTPEPTWLAKPVAEEQPQPARRVLLRRIVASSATLRSTRPPASAVPASRPPASELPSPDVTVPAFDGPVWHRGTGAYVDTEEDPVHRVQRCLANGLDVDLRHASVTCRE